MRSNNLKQQLRKAGASKEELASLSKLASQLSAVQPERLSKRTQERIAGIPGLPEKRSLLVHWTLGGSFAALAVVIVIAQSSMPGTVLYNVKRGGEELRTLVQPSYTDSLVEKRLEEVETLKQKSAEPDKIKKAEEAYKEASQRSRERRRRSNNNEERNRQENWRGWNWRDNDNNDSQSEQQDSED